MRILLISILLLNAFHSSACMCSLSDFSQAEYNLTQEIFVGKIVNESYDESIDRYLLEFEVFESYKGEFREVVVVQNQSGKRSVSTCEFSGKIGQIYLMFLVEKKKYYDVSYCTRKEKVTSMKDFMLPTWFSPYSGIVDGWHKQYYPNNEVESEGKLVLGQAVGMWKFYNDWGVLVQRGEYDDGLKNGEWVTYFADGSICEINNFENGAFNGAQITYDSQTGLKTSELFFVNNKYDGVLRRWYPTGVLSCRETYKMDSLIDRVCYDWEGIKWEGKNINISCEYGYGGVHEVIRDGVSRVRTRIWNSDSVLTDIWWKGTPVFQMNEDGVINLEKGVGFYQTTKQFGQVKDSLKTGLWEVVTYENEIEKCTYEKGRLNGIYERVSSNGVLIEEGNYTDGNKLGVWRRFYSDGQLKEEVEISFLGSEKLLNTFDPQGNQMIIDGNGVQFFYSHEGEIISEMKFKYKNGVFKKALKWKRP